MMRQGKQLNLILAAFLGAAAAVIVGLAGSYLTSRWAGLVEGPAICRGLANFYAIAHVPMVSSGTLGGEKIRAVISLPVTVWIVVPILALIIGGGVAARLRRPGSRWDVAACAGLAAVLYAIMLAALSQVAYAGISPAALPAVQGAEFNPPNLPFHPDLVGTVVSGIVFGLVGLYLGALLAVRGDRRLKASGEWWACLKAVVCVAIVGQLVLAGLVCLVIPGRSPASRGLPGGQVVRMLPTVTGMGTALLYGADLKCGMESSSQTSAPIRSFYLRANLYGGLTRNDTSKKSHKSLPVVAVVAAIFAAVLAAAAGWLAVRWGSSGASLLTALRVTAIDMVYVAVLVWACSLGWESNVSALGVAGSSRVFATPAYGFVMLPAAVGIIVFSLAGAHLADRITGI